MSTVVNKTPRLPAAAKEFNVGMATLVEFLTGKGFAVTNSPAFKLTEDMYTALEVVYASDRATKQRSDALALPKTEAKKREEAPVLAKKPIAAAKPAEPAPKETPPVEAPKAEPAQPVAEKEAPKGEPSIPEPVAEAPVVAAPAEKEAEQPVAEEKPKKTAKKKEEAEEPAVKQDDVTHIETKAEKLSGPKVLGKINVDDLDSGTRPKKGAAKKTATKAEAPVKEKETAAKTKKAEAEQPTPEVPAKATPEITPTPAVAEQPKTVAAPVIIAKQQPETKEEEKPEHIEMKAPQLTGPKIIGRIELPVNDPSKNGGGNRRERKRIPVTKRPENFRTGAGGNNTGQQQGGGQGGGQQGQGGGFNRGGQGQGQGGGGFNRGRTGGPGTGAGTGGNRPGTGTGQPGEVDQKEIQRKIQETQARLSGGGRGGRNNQKGKYRRDKRELMAEKRAQQENKGDGNVLPVTEFISVSELANLMDVSFADVISKCMGLGIMVSINQRLDAEVIELVAAEFGYEAQFINLEQEGDAEIEDEADNLEAMEPRAPIVTIMGHVDHGKTSLLDYIRAANVVAGEAGGITQHIGAYQVSTDSGKKITFLDTPGHEAFTAMRARGAKVADVAVIVIAADDAIMPQTREAISHAQAAQLPMIFALNKIDKEGADPERIRQQLSAMNILVEEWGGNYQSQEISAKKGLNVDLLLEKIGLQAELLELTADPTRHASGSVIEASLDKGRGYVATILVQNGTLKQGDMIVTGQHYGRVKAMLNERGQRVEEAGPSAPVQVLGLNGAPQAGEKFKMYDDEDDAKEVASHRSQILREQGIRARKVLTIEEIGRRIALGNFKELPVIIKGDFDGSVEALSDSLQKLATPEIAINVVLKGVGQITESDVDLASASDAIIIGFQVRPSVQASKRAEQEDVEIRFYSIIYDAIHDIKTAMEGLLEPTKETKIMANVEVREVYKISGVGTIAGCYVTDGKIGRASRINIIRDGKVVHTGELASLKRFKDDMKEVASGYECGLSVKNYADIRVGDIIEGFEEIEVKRTLASSAAAS